MKHDFACLCGRQHKLSPFIRHHAALPFLLVCDCGALWSTQLGVVWMVANAPEEGATE